MAKRISVLNSLRKSRAFTLIELLVVIAILGILAALIILSLQNGQKKAGDADRKTKARSLASAVSQYFVDYNRYPFNANDPDGIGPPGGTGAASGVDIEKNGVCADILQSTLVSTTGGKKYLEAAGACLDKDPTVIHRYKSLLGAQPGQAYYIIAWELKYQGETAKLATDSGNGVYRSTIGGPACASGVGGDGPGLVGSGTLTGNASANRITISCIPPNVPTKYFVVYGPQ